MLYKLMAQLPDCFSLVVSYHLEPREVQVLRCTSKKIKQHITRSMRYASFDTTEDKYSRVFRMPDGAVRIYTQLGLRKFDMHVIPDSYFLDPGHVLKTPRYTLKQDGHADQVGHILCVEDEITGVRVAVRDDIFIKGNGAIQNASWVQIQSIHHDMTNNGKSTTIQICVDFAEIKEVFVTYKFTTNY
jgi:phage-related protein